MEKRKDLKTFSMNPDTFQHLDDIAKRCGCSRSSVLSILINNYWKYMNRGENNAEKDRKE